MPTNDARPHPLFALCEAAIGHPHTSPQVQAVIEALPGAPARSTLPRGERHYLAWHAEGVQLVIGDGALAQASFHLQPSAPYAAFSGPLIGPLAAGSDLALAASVLGAPDARDDGLDEHGRQRLPAWLRYRRGPHMLHVEAEDGRQLSLVALVDS